MDEMAANGKNRGNSYRYQDVRSITTISSSTSPEGETKGQRMTLKVNLRKQGDRKQR